jgi:hypothetical protein
MYYPHAVMLLHISINVKVHNGKIEIISLRIPMFLVGKPGSSKSLAKTIVADAMQGNAALKDLFKNYKQVS